MLREGAHSLRLQALLPEAEDSCLPPLERGRRALPWDPRALWAWVREQGGGPCGERSTIFSACHWGVSEGLQKAHVPASDRGCGTKFPKFLGGGSQSCPQAWFSRQRGPAMGIRARAGSVLRVGVAGRKRRPSPALSCGLREPHPMAEGSARQQSWEPASAEPVSSPRARGQLVRPRRVCGSDSSALGVLTLTTGNVTWPPLLASAAPVFTPCLAGTPWGVEGSGWRASG